MKIAELIKKLSAAALVVCMLFAMTGCSTSSSAYTTVNGVTEGTNKVSTSDKGSASFNVKGNHVEMTNFSFDADASLKVMAEIPEEPMVYCHVVVHDGENTAQNISDGEYKETFTAENVADAFNDIYKTTLGASDSPVTSDAVMTEEGVFEVIMELTDGQLVMLAKEGSNKFVSIAITTMEYGSQEIVDAAFNALKD